MKTAPIVRLADTTDAVVLADLGKELSVGAGCSDPTVLKDQDLVGVW
jgi:hypothetical protein